MGGWLAGKQIQHQHGTTDLEGLFSLAPATPEENIMPSQIKIFQLRLAPRKMIKFDWAGF